MSGTQIKTEYSSWLDTFTRFHNLFLMLDMHMVGVQIFKKGDMINAASVLNVLFNNLQSYFIPDKRDEISAKLKKIFSVIDDLRLGSVENMQKDEFLELIKNLRENLNDVHKEICFAAQSAGLLIPWYEKKGIKERMKEAVLGRFDE